MNKLIIKKGEKYGMLTVVDEGRKLILPSGQVNRTITCKCDCGVIKDIRLLHLVRGRISSCGCKPLTRGGYSNKEYSYIVWNAIKTRCKPNYIDKHIYYDRGITICDEWANYIIFKTWAENNGIKKGLHIDRKNNNFGYSPDNCRFVSPKVNANNRRNTFIVNYNGNNIPFMILMDKLKLNPGTIRSRIKKGWTLNDAINKKIGNNYSGRLNKIRKS